MKKEYIYLRACLYAIKKLVQKDDADYAIKVDKKWYTVSWDEVKDWLIEQAEQKGAEKGEQE